MYRISVTSYRSLFCLLLLVLVSTAAFAADTLTNLQALYTAQTATQIQLTAYAVQADTEGYKTAAALFRAAAKSKGIHLPAYEKAIKALGGQTTQPDAKPPVVKTTKENLETAMKAETEVAAQYAEYMKQADADKKAGTLKGDATKAGIFLGGDSKAGVELLKLYKKGLDNLDAWKSGGKEFLVCTVCSYITDDTTVKQCPVCSAPREKFESFK
ncbi:TPA: hypothetical protein DDW35_08030 [Candidatus Sumerlaeota bacterium]|jgi:rubrerythrin|nr:hypothetical protein [Candidatus Sumerlaeota bacterium]